MSGHSPAARCPQGSSPRPCPATRSTTETVPVMPLVTYAAAVSRVDRHAAGLLADPDLGQLDVDVMATARLSL